VRHTVCAFPMNPVLKLLMEGVGGGAAASAAANALGSVSQLAEVAGLSEPELSAQLDELKKQGVFLGWRPVLDLARASEIASVGEGGTQGTAIAPEVRAVIEVRLTPERGGGFNRLAKRISLFDEVESCFLMSGGYDLLVFVKGASMQKVAGFVSEKLSTISGVLSTATHFQLRCYKDQGFVLDPAQSDAERLSVAP